MTASATSSQIDVRAGNTQPALSQLVPQYHIMNRYSDVTGRYYRSIFTHVGH